MVRTEVDFDPGEYKQVKKEAKALGISIAEYVRRAVRGRLPVDGDKPWMRYVDMVESGDPNSSQKVDEIIYGVKDGGLR